MKQLLLGTVVAAAMIGPALAADMRAPVMKAPPAPVAITSWTGCYVAGGGGYGMWNQETSFSINGVLIGSDVTTGGRGWFGTVGGGCDLQVSGNWVIGIFGDYDFASIKGDIAVPFGGPTFWGDEKLRSAWAVGGRIGYVITPSFMTYVSGGFTQARFSGADLFVPTAPAVSVGLSVAANTYSGWFLGSGYEYRLNWLPGLFWRTEYRFAQYDRDSRAILSGGVVIPGYSADSEKFVQTIRSELVWRWNWGR